MVSGFFTSPCDHSRIFSAEAKEMRIAENERGSLGFSKKLKMSFMIYSLLRRHRVVVHSPTKSIGFDQLHVQAERLELFHEHVEALGEAGVERVVTLHDRLVHPSASLHVVGLDGEELLESVGRAVRLHGPDLHLA